MNEIKYVDLNGLKVFAEELKSYLKSHILEVSIYNELNDRIEAVENRIKELEDIISQITIKVGE